jgi:Cell wall-active antibiotics response 4TMS YvqF
MDDRQVQDPVQGQEEMKRRRPGGSGGLWAGLFLLLVGGVLLLDQLGFPLPDQLFNWHVLLIAIGLFLGLRHNFRGGAWLILIAIGGVYMIQDYYPNIELHRFIWPGVLILAGLMFILRPRRHFRDQWHQEWKEEWKQKWRDDWERKRRDHGADPRFTKDTQSNTGNQFTTGTSNKQSYASEDFIDATSIFGGVHKKMVSKNFKGGDVVTIMGGTEIDLTQADFTGTARLDITQVMGGTKIIVPAHWEVRTEVSAIFAGFEDKRQQPAMQNPDKILIIDGTSIFGGIELKNY